MNDAIDAAGLPMEEAACDLTNTVPTTPAGIVAAIRVIQTYRCDGDNKLMHKRISTTHALAFCEKHKVSLDWLLCGEPAGLAQDDPGGEGRTA